MGALTDRKSHFDFGENWARFAQGITEQHIARARDGVAKLLGSDLADHSFLEIGCGSGIHTLAALQLGAASVMAFDIDARAVETARALLSRHVPDEPWELALRSVFDIPAGSIQYDIVYSWGVLHHTGDMRRAIERAASLVKPQGRLVIALYRKTPMCGFWRAEKRFFVHGPRWYRPLAELTFSALFVLALALIGRNPIRYIAEYPKARGMSFRTDIRDWLGGYPYESAAPEEVRDWLAALGFAEERFFPGNTRLGLLGVGCDEYVFRKSAHTQQSS